MARAVEESTRGCIGQRSNPDCGARHVDHGHLTLTTRWLTAALTHMPLTPQYAPQPHERLLFPADHRMKARPAHRSHACPVRQREVQPGPQRGKSHSASTQTVPGREDQTPRWPSSMWAHAKTHDYTHVPHPQDGRYRPRAAKGCQAPPLNEKAPTNAHGNGSGNDPDQRVNRILDDPHGSPSQNSDPKRRRCGTNRAWQQFRTSNQECTS